MSEDSVPALDTPAPKRETDDERAARRASELQSLHGELAERVARIHQRHPAPFTSKSLRFEDLSDDERASWNNRRGELDRANAAYHAAVRATCERHRAEERALIAAARAKAEESAS